MIRHLRYLGLLLPLVASSSWAVEQNSAAHISPAGSQNAVEGPAENFTGRVRVDPLFTPDNDIRVSGAYVTFEPGARSKTLRVKSRLPRSQSGMSFAVSVPQTRQKSQVLPSRVRCLILPRSLINSCKRICSATFSPAITSTGKAASWQRLAH